MNRDVIRVVDKLRQRSVHAHLKTIDWSSSSEAPYIVEFDTTTRCNLACPDCISGSLLNQDEFPAERVVSLAHEMVAAGVRGVILIGGGEPMAHPRIGEVIEILGSNGVAIGITTNGLYLKKHLDVLVRHVDWIRVSVDAASPEVFQSLRPSRTGASLFSAVLDNMRAFAQARRPGQLLGYSFMVYSSGQHGLQGTALRDDSAQRKVAEARGLVSTNAHEIEAAAWLARDLGCDYLEVKPMYDAGHYLVPLPPEAAQVLEDQLRRARALEADGFRVIEATKLRAAMTGGASLEPKAYTRCAVSQLRTLVTPSGAYVCPYFRGAAPQKIGDLRATSFAEMWQGERRREVMAQLDPSRDCRMHCIRHDSNLHLEALLASGFETDPATLVEDYDPFI